MNGAGVVDGPLTGPSRDAVCRGCGRPGLVQVVDLGPQPPAERFIREAELATPDPRLPLRIDVCPLCWLVQLAGDPIHSEDEPAGLAFSISPTMRAHVAGLVDAALAWLPTDRPARVVEMASHGNRLHQLFRERGVASGLIEPVHAYATAARGAGVPTTEARLTPELADRLVAESGPADVFVDAFHLAHEAAPAEWVAGLGRLLGPTGTAVVEFDHVRPVIAETQYDGFRHGHASYLSLGSFTRMLAAVGLDAVDARPTPAYGGSLRVVVRHTGAPPIEGPGHALADHPSGDGVAAVLAAEDADGLSRLDAYRAFAARVAGARAALRAFLDARRADGSRVVGYGAPSRGNTLLNSSGATVDDIPFVVDRAPAKHGSYLPGSRIPIRPPEALLAARPDYVLVLTWDLVDEVTAQLAEVRSWGGRFVVPLPTVRTLD